MQYASNGLKSASLEPGSRAVASRSPQHVSRIIREHSYYGCETLSSRFNSSISTPRRETHRCSHRGLVPVAVLATVDDFVGCWKMAVGVRIAHSLNERAKVFEVN